MSEAVLNLTLLLSYPTGSFSCETILTCTLEDVVSWMLTHMSPFLCADKEYTQWKLEEENSFFQNDDMKTIKQLEWIWVNEIYDKEVKSLQILETSLPPYVYVRTRNREMVMNHRAGGNPVSPFILLPELNGFIVAWVFLHDDATYCIPLSHFVPSVWFYFHSTGFIRTGFFFFISLKVTFL